MAGKRTTRHDPASHLREASARWGGTSYKNAPTKSVSVGGTRFVYRELGIDTGVPVIFLNHLAANLDNWDPRVVDGIATSNRVITFDNRGIGASTGNVMTDRIIQIDEAAAQKSGRAREEITQERLKNIPMGRLGTIEEYGEICAFLCSRQAGYITGQTIAVDGGMLRGVY